MARAKARWDARSVRSRVASVERDSIAARGVEHAELDGCAADVDAEKHPVVFRKVIVHEDIVACAAARRFARGPSALAARLTACVRRAVRSACAYRRDVRGEGRKRGSPHSKADFKKLKFMLARQGALSIMNKLQNTGC